MRAKNVYSGDYDDDDDYGAVAAVAAQTISPRQVDIGKKLAAGKFAVVKRGALTVNNETHPVAVKMLQSTYTHVQPTHAFAAVFQPRQCFDAVGWAAGRASGL